MAQADFGILGMGLAGVLLAHALKTRGCRLAWADSSAPNAASPMAPGIVNPLAGRKFKLNADLARHHEATLNSFAALENDFGAPLWHPTDLIRIVESPAQAAWLEERRTDPAARQWIGDALPPGAHGPGVHDPHGSFRTRHAGWLDVPALVAKAQAQWQNERLTPAQLTTAAPVTIDCRGWRCAQDPAWRALPWKCARGEVLTLSLDADLPRHLWNGGGWLQPLPDGTWRAGATYAWTGFEEPPSGLARAELLTRLARWLRLPAQVQDQAVGVRAVVIDYRPVLGALPDTPHRLLFSGLGSHGAILGPACALHLADHLTTNAPLPRDLAVDRFFPSRAR